MSKATRETRKILHKAFPNAIAAQGKSKRPLAIGIHRQFFHFFPEMSRSSIRNALADYTGGPTYLRNVVAGAIRVDILGEPNGIVSVDDEAFARAKLARQDAKHRRVNSSHAMAELLRAAGYTVLPPRSISDAAYFSAAFPDPETYPSGVAHPEDAYVLHNDGA